MNKKDGFICGVLIGLIIAVIFLIAIVKKQNEGLKLRNEKYCMWEESIYED